jgi:RND family efflux transporter MFP subunit
MTAAAGAAAPLSVSGLTEPFLDVTVSAPVFGIINTQRFKEGQAVKKGDVILELDRRLEELEVARRKAIMDRAKTDLDSTRVLVSTTRSVSREELGKKQTEYDVAVAEHGIAVEQLARRQILAPFSGAIAEIILQAGSACAPYQPLVRLVDTTRAYFVGTMDGKAVAELHLDERVKVQVDGGPAVAARISYIAPVVDPASGLAKVKAIFDNPTGAVRPGLAARMSLE